MQFAAARNTMARQRDVPLRAVAGRLTTLSDRSVKKGVLRNGNEMMECGMIAR